MQRGLVTMPCWKSGCFSFCFISFLFSKAPFFRKCSLFKRSCKWGRRKDSLCWSVWGKEGKITEILCWNEGYRKRRRRDLTQPINFSTRTAPSSEVRMFPFSVAWGGGRREAFKRRCVCCWNAKSDWSFVEGATERGAKTTRVRVEGKGERG